jgi:hypothetical protein
MSANELEDLMSRLNTDPENGFRTNDLGFKINPKTKKVEPSYHQEQTHTRHGRVRGRRVNGIFTPMPMKDLSEMDVSKYEEQKPYHPVFGKFVVDDMGIPYSISEKFVLDENGLRKLPPTESECLRKLNLTPENVWALFWNEHWEKQALKRRLYNILNSRNNSNNFGGVGVVVLGGLLRNVISLYA